MTKVDQTIEEIQSLGPDGEGFARQLEGYITNYNMDAMVTALQ